MDSFKWINGGKEFLFSSERTGWRHVYRVSRENGTSRAVTQGNYDAIGIAGVNEKEGFLYFSASPQNATQYYLYRTKLDGSGEPERVSPAGADGWHTYDISPDGRWAFHTFSNFDTPDSTNLVRLPTHGTVRSLVDNADLKAKVAPFVAAAPREFFKADAGDGVTLDGWMLRPANFDPSKKYPVLVFIYGEAAGQTVLDSWSQENLAFHRTIAAQGYVVVSFDNRGTPAPKGRTWRKTTYGAIQPIIVKDQTAAIQNLVKSRRYLDGSRLAVWGWSGGATSTLSLMFRSPDVYKVGMAVAPVPDLRLYDTIYQERYMGLPLQNVEGYKNSAPINFAEGLKGHLLVMHGSGDDNVHYSGTELLLNRLIELGKPSALMGKPNRTQCICEGKGVSYNVLSRQLRYLESNLPAGPVNP